MVEDSLELTADDVRLLTLCVDARERAPVNDRLADALAKALVLADDVPDSERGPMIDEISRRYRETAKEEIRELKAEHIMLRAKLFRLNARLVAEEALMAASAH